VTGSWSAFLPFPLWPLTALGFVVFCLAYTALSIGYPKTLPGLQSKHNWNHWSERQTSRWELDKIIPRPKASHLYLAGWEEGMCAAYIGIISICKSVLVHVAHHWLIGIDYNICEGAEKWKDVWACCKMEPPDLIIHWWWWMICDTLPC